MENKDLINIIVPAYKNIKEFIYLHKVLGKFILGVNHKVLERNTIQK